MSKVVRCKLDWREPVVLIFPVTKSTNNQTKLKLKSGNNNTNKTTSNSQRSATSFLTSIAMTTNSTNTSTSSLRRSIRHRSRPTRYGFEDNVESSEPSEATTTSFSLQLLDLPPGVILHCLSYVSSAADRFAIQSVNKQFRDLSNTPMARKEVGLLGAVSSDAMLSKTLIKPEDTVSEAMQKLLPYAEVGNLQAIYLLAMVAIYVEYDMEVGVSLLRRGSNDGDVRCLYEFGLLSFKYDNVEQAIKCFREAANKGHVLSQIELCNFDIPGCSLEGTWFNKAEQTIAQNISIQDFILRFHKETKGLLRTAVQYQCSNPCCVRVRSYYNYFIRPTLLGENEPLWSNGWLAIRSKVLSHGVRSANDDWGVPKYRFFCKGCEVWYCSSSCRNVDWYRNHRRECSHRSQAARHNLKRW